MTDGFVGIDPNKAKNDIETYYQNSKKAISKIGYEIIYLFGYLRYYWCSPRAVSFYRDNADKIIDTINSMSDEVLSVIRNAIDAYNIVAATHGLSKISMDLFPYKLLGLPQLENDQNGNIGMRITYVENTMEYCEKRIKQAIENFDSIPVEIAFYDPDNIQNAAYQQAVCDSSVWLKANRAQV